MKIGILTLPLHTNYGGILQAYALQTVLERMGHEVKVVNYPLVRKPSFLKHFAHYIYRNILVRVCGNNVYTTDWVAYQLETFYIRKHTNRFIEGHIHNRFASDLNEIKPDEFDAIVVGSDQVWRKGYSLWPDITDSYLKFTKGWNIKRYAYATSFGKDNISDYTENEIDVISKLLQSFDKVSVREFSGIDVCQNIFNIIAEQQVDPTLLLTEEDYCRLIGKSNQFKFSGNFFNYVLDDNEIITETISEIENMFSWKSFIVNGIRDKKAKLEDRIQKPVEMWLQAFRDADAIITDSFHACVFSIIFNKPFLVFGNTKRGLSRFETLLSITGLQNRLVITKEEVLKKAELLRTSPNVNEKVDACRKSSFVFFNSIK